MVNIQREKWTDKQTGMKLGNIKPDDWLTLTNGYRNGQRPANTDHLCLVTTQRKLKIWSQRLAAIRCSTFKVSIIPLNPIPGGGGGGGLKYSANFDWLLWILWWRWCSVAYSSFLTFIWEHISAINFFCIWPILMRYIIFLMTSPFFGNSQYLQYI